MRQFTIRFIPNHLLLFIILIICGGNVVAQKTFFGEEEVVWENHKPLVMPAGINTYSTSDLVILDDRTQFYFYGTKNEKIVKNVIVKINTMKGLEELRNYKLPESFDYAHDACLYKSGRRSKIKIPFIQDFHLDKLMARKFSGGRWNTLSFDYKYESVKWISTTGKFLNDDVPVFNFQNLSVGDVIEIFYELQFNANYGSNLFYLNSKYPKINCEYEFIYKFDTRLSECEFILPLYVPDSTFTTSSTANDSYLIKRDKVKMRNLRAINYPANSYEGRSLPHVFVDFGFYRSLTGYYNTPSGRVQTYTFWRSKNFQWLFIKDTINRYKKNNRSKFESLRKYIATLPSIESDSNCKAFITALCDTLNSFRYLSYNQLFYNESQLYDLSRVDHLLKRRLVGSADLLWQDVFNDNNIFYYRANLEDLRYSDHSLYYRGHLGYEGNIFAVPYRTSYLYFIPRYGGINYHLNELPFYYEGAVACLFPKNFQENTPDKDNKTFKFVKMHKGTFNDNTRTENATVFIPLDSLKTRLVIKESLSGQFSTVLRHLYLHEYIDSTISPHYFKKCTKRRN